MCSLWRLDSAGLLCVECMDCHDFASAKSRNDACFSSSRILGIAVLLVLFFTNFGRELDLRSAVLSKFVKPVQ